MNNLSLLQALAFEPRQAFAELDARPRWLWPALALAIATATFAVAYVMFVDLEWLTDIQLRNSALTQNLTEEQIAARVRTAADSRVLNAWISGIGGCIVVMIIMLISGAYYLLAGKITGVERSYRHWLALSAWSSVPGIIGIVLSGVMLFTAGTNQIGQAELQPLSLNQLLAHREMGEPGYTLLSSINLFQLLSLWLAIIGVKAWSGRSWLFAIVLTGLPWVLVYGIWAFFSFR